MADILNEANEEEETLVPVGETTAEATTNHGSGNKVQVGEQPPGDQVQVGERLPEGAPATTSRGGVTPPEQLLVSPIDVFGLDQARFKEEQKRTPWLLAMIAFLESSALALDAQLQAKVLSLAPHYAVKNGILMRRVRLKARAGPARLPEVPIIPVYVLHHCHADVFAAHVGVPKTLDKVHMHAY